MTIIQRHVIRWIYLLLLVVFLAMHGNNIDITTWTWFQIIITHSWCSTRVRVSEYPAWSILKIFESFFGKVQLFSNLVLGVCWNRFKMWSLIQTFHGRSITQRHSLSCIRWPSNTYWMSTLRFNKCYNK